MEETQSKKVIILYILKILKEFSDEEHPITQSDIIAKLKDYGIDCDRKTITRNIKYLIDYGFNIVRNLGGGCYFINDKYDTSEITFLVDCLYSYPAISQRQAQNLIDKLTSEVSKYERLKFKNIYKSNELTRTDNKQIFYNIDQINFAIANDKQISFIYNKYNKNKKLVPRIPKCDSTEESLRSLTAFGMTSGLRKNKVLPKVKRCGILTNKRRDKWQKA